MVESADPGRKRRSGRWRRRGGEETDHEGKTREDAEESFSTELQITTYCVEELHVGGKTNGHTPTGANWLLPCCRWNMGTGQCGPGSPDWVPTAAFRCWVSRGRAAHQVFLLLSVSRLLTACLAALATAARASPGAAD